MFELFRCPWTKALALVAMLAGVAPEAAEPPPGQAFILSAPSGTGKSTLIKRLARQVDGLVFAVSHTTRAPRAGEREGVDYVFVDDAAFDRIQAAGGFLECVSSFGHRYGLDRAWVEGQLKAGRDVLMDLDTTGARMARRALPDGVSVFLLPPSAGELARRLRGRGTEGGAEMALRLGRAREELACFTEYDYLVVNGSLDQASREVEGIILAARARQARRCGEAHRILAGF